MPDARRFEALVLPHLNAGYNLARWLAREPHDAEDVVQDACIRAFKYLDALQGDDARAWFLAIVRNTFYDWVRRNRPAGQVTCAVSGERTDDGTVVWAQDSVPAVSVAWRTQEKPTAGALAPRVAGALIVR